MNSSIFLLKHFLRLSHCFLDYLPSFRVVTVIGALSLAQISADVSSDEVLDLFRLEFPGIDSKEIQLKSFQDGRSNANVYLIELEGRPLVLRLNDPKDASKNHREILIHREASNIGIAPKIFCASEDGRMILMEYIPEKTITIGQAKEPENIFKIATALRELHKIPGCQPQSVTVHEKISELYRRIQKKGAVIPGLDNAFIQIPDIRHRINSFEKCPTTTHGDLNPFNIFITNSGVKLIDWSEVGCEDPFYDLSCFALCHDFSEEEEYLLLKHYLGKEPNDEEKVRYSLLKRLDYVYFATELFFISLEQQNTSLIKEPSTDLEWSHYIDAFQKHGGALSAEFLYDFGCCALKMFFSESRTNK